MPAFTSKVLNLCGSVPQRENGSGNRAYRRKTWRRTFQTERIASTHLRCGQGPPSFTPVEGRGGRGERELARSRAVQASVSLWMVGVVPCLSSLLPLGDLSGRPQNSQPGSSPPSSTGCLPSHRQDGPHCSADQPQHSSDGRMRIPLTQSRPACLRVVLVLFGVTFHVSALIHFVLLSFNT